MTMDRLRDLLVLLEVPFSSPKNPDGARISLVLPVVALVPLNRLRTGEVAAPLRIL